MLSTKYTLSYEELTQQQIKDLPIDKEILNPILDEVAGKVERYIGRVDWMDSWAEVWDQNWNNVILQVETKGD